MGAAGVGGPAVDHARLATNNLPLMASSPRQDPAPTQMTPQGQIRRQCEAGAAGVDTLRRITTNRDQGSRAFGVVAVALVRTAMLHRGMLSKLRLMVVQDSVAVVPVRMARPHLRL